MYKKISLSFILMLVVLSSLYADSRKNIKYDAVTKATAQQGDVLLPVKSNTYTIVGVVDGIAKFVIKYDEIFFRGGLVTSEKGFQTIKTRGVKTIISIAPSEEEKKLASKYKIDLVEIPFDKESGPREDDLRRFLDTITKKAAAPFYVHCNNGTHRAGILGMAYRMHVLNWPYSKASLEFERLGGDLRSDKPMLEKVKGFNK